MLALLAACVSLLVVGGGAASAGNGGPVHDGSSNQLSSALQEALVAQTSSLLAAATNSVGAGGNICFAGCPAVAVGTNLLQSTQLNIGVVQQTINQVTLSNIGNPTISIVGIQLVAGP